MNQTTPVYSAIQIGLSDHAKQIIGMHSDQGSIVRRINTICQRYDMIIARDCPVLTVAEWMALCEALMGPKLIDLPGWENVQTFWCEVCDADRLGGLGEKWGIDADALAARLKEMPYAQKCSVLEVASRFWSDGSGRIWSSDAEMLEAYGARIGGSPEDRELHEKNRRMPMKKG